MNLITCAEPCEYQREGYCQLNPGAQVFAARVNGCSYFQPITKNVFPLQEEPYQPGKQWKK